MKTDKATVQNEKDVVVFIIGMKIHKFFYVHQWIPIAKAMGTMLKELYQNKNHGFQNGELHLNWKGITVIQYWDGFEQLETFAHEELHRGIWKEYYQKADMQKVVGIFHETYIVPAKNYEAIYVNMPEFGLGKARSLESIDQKKKSSRQRLHRPKDE